MTKVTVAALQLAFSEDLDDNVAMVSDHVVKAAARGAKIILPPELFEGHYFCKVEDEALFANAKPIGEHPAVAEMRKVAKAERVYIPTSFFERDGQHHYNSLAMIDDEGEIMGVYRKSHIPDGPGYEEKILFPPRQQRVQGVGDAIRHDRCRHLLGPMVSGGRARDGADGC